MTYSDFYNAIYAVMNMNKLVLSAVLLIVLSGCESTEDKETAQRVIKYLDSAGVVLSSDRSAENSQEGKIVYFTPGVNGRPVFTYYEVTSRDEILKLRLAAETALKEVPEVKSITLRFMEKQVLDENSSGALTRGKEKEVSQLVIKR